jgi:putative transposase
MEAEVSGIVGAEKNAHNPSRRDYRCGYRPRRLDTRMGTMYLMVPKLRNQGYIPFFVTERKRSEAALIQVVQEAFVQGVSTRKMEKLARSLGIENLSRSQVSEMTKGLNEQVQYFRSRPLTGRYPVIWTDALYEKIRMDGRVVSMAVMVVCGVNEQGHRDIIAVEPMLDESKESYSQLFQSLLDRGLKTPLLVVSDANKGLIAAIRESFPGASWQRCKVHFMRNILAHVPQKDKESFAAQLKEIWLAPSAEIARQRAKQISEQYGKRFPKAIELLQDGLEALRYNLD